MDARRISLPLLTAAVLTACHGAPAGGGAGMGVGVDVPAAEDVGPKYRILAVEELPIVAITTDGDAAGFPKARLDDGDLSTQWSSATYRAATAWAAVQLAAPATIAAVRVKTGVMPAGTSYDVQVSDDGTTWRTALAGATGTSWNLERKALPAGTRGKFVRIFWRNSAANPQPRFSIYELAVDGEPGTTPTPAPTATPTTAPTATPTPPPSSGPVVKLAIAGATASSTYDGLTPERAIDGDQATQWANGGYKEQEASWTLDLGAAKVVDHLRVKTGYLPASVTYDIAYSLDGTTWGFASFGHNNASWDMVQRPIAARARYVRISFHNYGATPIARMPLYEVEAWGRASATDVARTMHVAGATHRTTFHPGAGIGGTWQSVIDVSTGAFNDKAAGVPFAAMLGVDRGRYGWTYARITPQNAHRWGGDLGGSGGVSFLDTADGLADNAGSWIFTHRDFNDEVYPIECKVEDGTTTWRTDRAASVDLGPTVRKWTLTTSEDPTPYDAKPAIFVVFKRPDGLWDFAQANGAAQPELSYPGPIEAAGRVYAFYITSDDADPCPDLDVTLTAQE